MAKTYLGDGVYCDFDGHSLVLTTENGIESTNTIYLESEVYAKLAEFVEELRERRTPETRPASPLGRTIGDRK